MVSENWQITRLVSDLDEQGNGTVVHQIEAKYGTLSYVFFSPYLDADSRDERLIGNQWDLSMALCEGAVDAQSLVFRHNNVPKQEAGHVHSRVLASSVCRRRSPT